MVDIQQAIKDDAGKPRLDLIDASTMIELGKVLDSGAQKYGANNWRNGLSVSRALGAAERHIAKLKMRMHENDIDPEHGTHHAVHAIAELMFVYWTLLNRPDCDDRYNPKMQENVDSNNQKKVLRKQQMIDRYEQRYNIGNRQYSREDNKWIPIE